MVFSIKNEGAAAHVSFYDPEPAAARGHHRQRAFVALRIAGMVPTPESPMAFRCF